MHQGTQPPNTREFRNHSSAPLSSNTPHQLHRTIAPNKYSSINHLSLTILYTHTTTLLYRQALGKQQNTLYMQLGRQRIQVNPALLPAQCSFYTGLKHRSCSTPGRWIHGGATLDARHVGCTGPSLPPPQARTTQPAQRKPAPPKSAHAQPASPLHPHSHAWLAQHLLSHATSVTPTCHAVLLPRAMQCYCRMPHAAARVAVAHAVLLLAADKCCATAASGPAGGAAGPSFALRHY